MKTHTTTSAIRSAASPPRAPLGTRIRERLLLWERLWANARPSELV
jgi:hypothetical protein